MRYRYLSVPVVALMLAACGSSDPAPDLSTVDLEGYPTDALPKAPEPVGPSPAELAALDDQDCRVVAEAYAGALSRGAFDYAAMFWNDPVIDGERLAALYSSYVTPNIAFADVQEEGAAGSIYCTVSGRLTDASDPRVAPEPGELILHRVNDVAGATEQQLRWSIRSSTFVEPMEQSRREDQT